MLQDARQFLQEHYSPKSPFLLACSGGVDSMVLATLLFNESYSFSVAHVNFKLRGEEADADQHFVRQWCEQRNISFYTKNFYTKAYAKEQGFSTQIAARKLRYKWFEELRLEHGFSHILMAHHLNDTLETALYHLVKGGGIAGLSGMPLLRERIARPLLFHSRAEILEFAKEYQVKWREDASNQSTDYRRNKIRHEIVPILKGINPNLDKTAKSTFERLRGTQEIIRHIADDCLSQSESIGGGFRLPIQPLLKWPQKSIILHEILRGYGFNFFQATQIGEGLEQADGQVFLSANYELYIRGGVLQVLPLSNNLKSHSLNPYHIQGTNGWLYLAQGKLSWKVIEGRPKSFRPPSECAYFDWDKLPPLLLRCTETGDRIQPFGMKGSRLVSDLLSEAKYSPQQRQQALLVCGGTTPLWLVGLRSAGNYSLSQHTQNTLVLSWDAAV